MNKKQISIIFFSLILLGLFKLSYDVTFTNATITGDAPPSSGNWIIENDTAVEDEILIINSSIIIRGSANVNFTNTTFLFNTTTPEEIRINTTGTVKFDNCTLKAYNKSDPLYDEYSIVVLSATEGFTMTDSIIEDCGSSFESNFIIHSSSEIRNCIFNGSYYGLYFIGLDNDPDRYSIIENNTFYNSTIYDINAQSYSNLTFSNNIFYGTENYGYGGYRIINCTNVTFANNIFNQKLSSFAYVDIVNSTKVYFYENSFNGLYKGISIDNSSTSEIYDNQFLNCYYSIFTDKGDDIKIYGNNFDSVYTGVYGTNSTNIDIYSNNFDNTTHSAAQIREGSTSCKFRDNSVTDSQQYGVFIYYSIQTIISNNSIERCSHQAIFNKFSNNSIIRENFIRDNGWQGIHCYGSNNVTIENNVIKDNLREGVFLEESTSSSMLNNNITSNVLHGVALRHCDDIYVYGNKIKHNIGNGVSLYDDSSDIMIEKNTISFNEGCGVYIEAGSSATFIDNIIEINGEGLIVDENSSWLDYLPWIIGISSVLLIIIIIVVVKKRKKKKKK
ncbi:MAG: right-handed parallel beta-helix repeat-containing protein [Promethearchaeota archaeon]